MIPALIANLHNDWLALPLWLRTGIGTIVAAVVALAFAFGFTWPTSLADVQAQAVAFAVVAVPTIIALFKSQLLPYIVRWFLGSFGYAQIGATASSYGLARLPRYGNWVKA